MKKNRKIDVESNAMQTFKQPIHHCLTTSAFSQLEDLQTSLPSQNLLDPSPTQKSNPRPKVQNRIEIRRLTAGKGGKTVTEINFKGYAKETIQQFLKNLKQFLSCGGTLKDEIIELQGDHRKSVEEFFTLQGYKVIRCGG